MKNILSIIYAPCCMNLCSHSKSNGSNSHIDYFHLFPKSLTLPRNDKGNKKKICKFRFSPLVFEHGSSIRGFMRIPYGLFRVSQGARSGSCQTLPLELENIREIDDSISVTIVLFSESGKMVANKHR